MFKLSKLADYSIVIMTHMVQEGEHSVHTAKALADKTKLPLPTVGKILKALSRGGMLVSHRGSHGGYSVLCLPKEVSIANIIRAIDGEIALTECSSSAPGLCELEHVCPVRSNWRIINQTVIAALQKLSIADMTLPLPKSIMHIGQKRRSHSLKIANSSPVPEEIL